MLRDRQDASGVQQFFYGNMGEITQTIHTFVMPQGPTYTLQMDFEYDSWNRIKQMTYPDGEVVTYGYDAGGQLVSMQGMKDQDLYDYINSIEYNRYGSRTAIEYGNGTSAEYTYDPLMQRLTNLKTWDIHQEPMQDITYQYDNASNITSISNSAAALPNGLGGSYTYGYQYDSLYRLTHALGSFNDHNNDYYFHITQMQYSAAGNIINKTVNANLLLDGSVQSKSYNHQYTYNQSQPHTLASVGNSTFNWDLNGNMIRHDNRQLCWDEENRLGSVRDPEHFAAYLYNAGGERVWKFTGGVAQMGQSGKTVIEQVMLSNKTLYASSFFVANDQGYTKHFFAGSERICSKIGGGLQLAPVDPMGEGVEALYENHTEIAQHLYNLLHRFANCNPEPYVTAYIDMEPYLGGIQEWLNRHEPEENRFFYHPDHLGSSSFITDAAGEGYQHLQYMPFGETSVSQKISWWSTPYQFTGKEKDDETGYNYFGARYYNSDLSVWLSVDPMADKYPSMSAYMYCAGNPVILVDPDGRMYLNFNQSGEFIGKTHDNWFHNTFVGTRGRVIGKNGEVIQKFKFADPKNDSRMILNRTINKLIIVNQNQIKQCLVEAGAFDEQNRDNSISFLEREGRVGGSFDFSFGAIPRIFNVDQPKKNSVSGEWESSSIFLVGKMAHNHMNFGNFLFGAGGATLGVPLRLLRLGAHINSRFPTDVDGNRVPKGSPNPNGYPPQWDSQDDQLSIKQGYKYAKENIFHRLNKPIGIIIIKSPVLLKTE